MPSTAKKIIENPEIKHFITKPKKPRWWIRIFCRKVPQDGYVQKCDGIVYGQRAVNHTVFFAGHTEEETAYGLRLVIRESQFKFKFKPVRWSPVYPYHSFIYVPFWKKLDTK